MLLLPRSLLSKTPQYFEFHSHKWGNKKHKAQFHSRLANYVFPVMGSLPVAAIDKTLILKAIQPIWTNKNKTAVRTLRIIKAVLDYAKVNGWREGDNPAVWTGNLAHAFPTLSSNKHHPALPFVAVADFMEKLSVDKSIAAHALEFAILTGARSGEVRAARWAEIDMAAKLWVVPATRTKTKKEHRVPLWTRAGNSQGAATGGRRLRIHSMRKGKPLGYAALQQVLKRLRPGFRSTFRDWAAERTSYPNHVVEMALAHTIGNAVEAAYRRGDLLTQRAHLMADWARYCSTPAVPAVQPIWLVRA